MKSPSSHRRTTASESAWAARVSVEASTNAAALRLLPGVRCLAQGRAFWLRGDALTDELAHALRLLPGAERFYVSDDGALTAPDGRLPLGELPDGDWRPIAEWFPLALPTPALAGRLSRRAAVRLVRSAVVRDANVLLVPAAEWKRWASTAPRVRLNALTFAASDDGRVVVRGYPLPPIAGARFVETDGVAVPAGYECSPPVDAATLRSAFDLAAGDLAMLTEGGGIERIPAAGFVAAAYAAVRATFPDAPDA